MPYDKKALHHTELGFEVKSIDEAGDEQGGWELEGYASAFDVRDKSGDTVRKGAFVNSLKERTPMLFWRHDEPIGTVQAKEDDTGLLVKAHILPTRQGRDTYTLLKGGAVDRLSIGWLPREGGMKSTKDGRDLTDIDLFEVSVVPIPMLDAARVTAVKEDEPEPRPTVDGASSKVAEDLLTAIAHQKARYVRRAGDGKALTEENLKALGELTVAAGEAFVEGLELELKARTSAVPDARLQLLRGMVMALAAMLDAVPDVEGILQRENENDNEQDELPNPGAPRTGKRGQGRKDDGQEAEEQAMAYRTAIADRQVRYRAQAHGGR